MVKKECSARRVLSTSSLGGAKVMLFSNSSTDTNSTDSTDNTNSKDGLQRGLASSQVRENLRGNLSEEHKDSVSDDQPP